MSTESLLFFGGFGLLLLSLLFGIVTISRRKATVKEWPSTMGTVLVSTLEKRLTPAEGVVYADYALIQYSYQVAGRIYQGKKIKLGTEFSGKEARKLVARYPVGAQVMVFYNPRDPSEAVLERNDPVQWVLLFILIVFACTLYNIFQMGIMP